MTGGQQVQGNIILEEHNLASNFNGDVAECLLNRSITMMTGPAYRPRFINKGLTAYVHMELTKPCSTSTSAHLLEETATRLLPTYGRVLKSHTPYCKLSMNDIVIVIAADASSITKDLSKVVAWAQEWHLGHAVTMSQIGQLPSYPIISTSVWMASNDVWDPQLVHNHHLPWRNHKRSSRPSLDGPG